MTTIDKMLTRELDNPMEAMLHTAIVQHRLEHLSDEEIGHLLLDHVWAELPSLDPRSALLSVAVDRLRRR